MITTTLPNNLTSNDIDFLQRHEDYYLLHHELTSRFLSIIREYPDCKREDFSNAFTVLGRTLFTQSEDSSEF